MFIDNNCAVDMSLRCLEVGSIIYTLRLIACMAATWDMLYQSNVLHVYMMCNKL